MECTIQHSRQLVAVSRRISLVLRKYPYAVSRWILRTPSLRTRNSPIGRSCSRRNNERSSKWRMCLEENFFLSIRDHFCGLFWQSWMEMVNIWAFEDSGFDGTSASRYSLIHQGVDYMCFVDIAKYIADGFYWKLRLCDSLLRDSTILGCCCKNKKCSWWGKKTCRFRLFHGCAIIYDFASSIFVSSNNATFLSMFGISPYLLEQHCYSSSSHMYRTGQSWYLKLAPFAQHDVSFHTLTLSHWEAVSADSHPGDMAKPLLILSTIRLISILTALITPTQTISPYRGDQECAE